MDAGSSLQKRSNAMITSWLSKLTNPAVVRAAVIALALSPAISLANTPAKAKGTHRHVAVQPIRQTVQFQGQQSQADWDHDADGFYKPTQSPGFNSDFGS
jgi:hypothetical protein